MPTCACAGRPPIEAVLASAGQLIYPLRRLTHTRGAGDAPSHPPNPGLMQVATQAQHMAATAKQERMAVVFQTVSVVSVAVMGLAASAHLLRELFRPAAGHGRGRG